MQRENLDNHDIDDDYLVQKTGLQGPFCLDLAAIQRCHMHMYDDDAMIA